MKNNLSTIHTKQLEVLLGLRIDDVSAHVAFIPQTGGKPIRAVVIFDNFYLQVGKQYIRLLAVDSDLSLLLTLVDAIDYPAAQNDEEEISRLSISHLTLWDELMDNRIDHIVFWGKAHSVQGGISTNAISFFLRSGQEIFVDSCSTLGLCMGGEGRRRAWIESAKLQKGYLTDAVLEISMPSN